MAALDVTQKADVYESLSSINRAFAAIVAHIQTMQQARVLTPKYQRLLQGFTQEVQAELNLKILKAMDGIESADWAQFGKVRQHWENYLRGPEPKPRKKTSR
jgi:hypothetical protein